MTHEQVWVQALDVATVRHTNYPSPFAKCVEGRERRRLGEVFGLRNFGVNLTRLGPGAQSALRHRHTSPADDLAAVLGADNRWVFTHKDGQPYC